MPDPLYGIGLKLSRAKQQFHALSADVQAFLEDEPYDLVGQYYPEGRELALVAKDVKPCDGMWGVRAGEIAHNLRSALDHLVWELIVHHTGSEPTHKTQFPIFKDEANYRDHIIRGVSPEARTLIKSLQPFATGESHKSPLWHLYLLSNFDKHRTLSLTCAAIAEAKLTYSGIAPGMRVLVEHPIGPLVDNALVLRLRFLDPGDPFIVPIEQVKVDGPTRGYVAFDDPCPEGAAGAPLLRALYEMGGRVVVNVRRIAEEILGKDFTVV